MSGKLHFQRMPSIDPRTGFLVRLASVTAALALANVVLALSGQSPLNMALEMFEALFGSVYGVQDFALLFTPLLLTGLAVAVARQVGAWNIGTEGQFYAGAFCTAAVGLFVPLPDAMLLPVMLLAGLAGGALWILIPAAARAYAGISELIVTLLMNFVALLMVYYVSTGPWRDKLSQSSTPRITAELPELWGLIHWGLPIALIALLVVTALMNFSRWGYEVRLVGSNPPAAEFAGVPAKRRILMVLLLSGALAGLAGMLEVAGTVHRLQGGISNNYGYLGIVVAVLARGSVFGVLYTAALIAFILNSGIILQTQGLSISAVLAITGLILFFTAIGDELAHYRLVRPKT